MDLKQDLSKLFFSDNCWLMHTEGIQSQKVTKTCAIGLTTVPTSWRNLCKFDSEFGNASKESTPDLNHSKRPAANCFFSFHLSSCYFFYSSLEYVKFILFYWHCVFSCSSFTIHVHICSREIEQLMFQNNFLYSQEILMLKVQKWISLFIHCRKRDKQLRKSSFSSRHEMHQPRKNCFRKKAVP